MEVLHHTRHPTGEAGWREDLDELLAVSDIVSLHVPLTDATRGMIDRRRIGLMKEGAVFVNTARGAVVDEAALAEALEEGHLLAAGLDVYENEPHVSPALLRAPRTVLLPHIGSATTRHVGRCYGWLARGCRLSLPPRPARSFSRCLGRPVGRWLRAWSPAVLARPPSSCSSESVPGPVLAPRLPRWSLFRDRRRAPSLSPISPTLSSFLPWIASERLPRVMSRPPSLIACMRP